MMIVIVITKINFHNIQMSCKVYLCTWVAAFLRPSVAAELGMYLLAEIHSAKLMKPFFMDR